MANMYFIKYAPKSVPGLADAGIPMGGWPHTDDWMGQEKVSID